MRNSSRNWVFPELLSVPSEIRSQIGGYSIVSDSLIRRGVTSLIAAQGFLNPDQYSPAPPSDLPDLLKASSRLIAAISAKENILVWGDFDVDGQTSTSLFVSALNELGAKVSHYIPNRASESHGISLTSLKARINQFHPSILLTCDTGIDAQDSIAFAESQGVDVIVTDHHQLPTDLPPAFALINPNRLSSNHPLYSLPGVGVAYKLIEKIFDSFSRSTDHFLDLVALGIVADVAQLTGDTRYLLQRGLPILANTPRLGLKQLYLNAAISVESLTEEQISFVIGPRLNALGRLDDANSCVDFFTTNDITIASRLAKQLEDLNNHRQLLTETIFNESLSKIDANPDLLTDYPVLVVEGPPSWNPGVIGIVASRLVERFFKPVIMLTKDGDKARGSARSIPGVSISDLIKRSAKTLDRFGGHPMAAGVSLPCDLVAQFRRDLAESYDLVVGDQLPAPDIIIDELLPFQSISIDYINDFYRLAPFGAGNPNLLFATRGVTLLQDRVIGKNNNHRKLTLKDSAGSTQDVLWWNSANIKLPSNPFDIAYSLSTSTFQNKLQAQITLQYYRESEVVPAQIKPKKPLLVRDLRNQSNPDQMLSEILREFPNSQIWAEYNTPSDYSSKPRGSLMPASCLIIWTSPPSIKVLNDVVTSVSPDTLVLIGQNPLPHNNRLVLETLLGMLLHLSETGKKFDPESFAQSIAQTSSLVLAGLDWIHYHGEYDLSKLVSDNIINPGPGSPLSGFKEVDQKFTLLLQEISSYRSFFQHADKEYIL